MKKNPLATYLFLILAFVLFGFFWGISTEKGKIFTYNLCSKSEFLGHFCPNLVKVDVSSELDTNSVIIKLQNDSINNKAIYKGGEKLFWVPHDYGRDIFNVYYKKTLLGRANVFNTNSWHNHIYKFKIKTKNDKILVIFSAEGPDGPGEFLYKNELSNV